MQPTSPRPGLVKIRAVPLLRRRNVALIVADSGRVGDLVEGADVVSEGRVEAEESGLWYYGSTSVLLLRRSSGGALPDGDVETLAAVLRGDPHVRVRVLRIARREAMARAGGMIGTLRAEIDVSPCARGVALLVEVVARVARGDLRSARGPEGAADGSGPVALGANAER